MIANSNYYIIIAIFYIIFSSLQHLLYCCKLQLLPHTSQGNTLGSKSTMANSNTCSANNKSPPFSIHLHTIVMYLNNLEF